MALHKKLLSKIARYYHTLKYLQPIQIYGQLLYRINKKPQLKKIINIPNIRHQHEPWQTAIIKKDKLHADPVQVECLNQTFNITKSTVWQDKTKSRLWLYHLHYFHYLDHFDTSEELILRWIKENPSGAGPGWEPYPISLRVVNWIKWLLQKEMKTTRMEMLVSLVQQLNYLYKRLEIHILGNHLLANAKALIFGGCYFENDHWLDVGMKIFNAQLEEQILADGGHFELSPMYHAIIFEDLLDVINLCQVYHYQYPQQWLTICEKMLIWLKTMCHPDGEFALFNDTAHNSAATLLELKEYYYRLMAQQIKLSQNNLKLNEETPGNNDSHHHFIRRYTIGNEFLNRTELAKNCENKNNNNMAHHHLAASGYCRMMHRNMVLIADIAEIGADYQPGHAHADTLSFELSIHQQRLLVNSGTSTYADNEKRLSERSTAAHNTVMINDKNSSDIWRSFRVAHRANVRDVKLQHKTLQATHDGYYRKYKVVHTRTWQFIDNTLCIKDEINGRGNHKITIIFHVHPDINVVALDDYQFLFLRANRNIAQLKCDARAKVHASTYHPGFNITLANQKIMIETNTSVPTTFNTVITCLGD